MPFLVMVYARDTQSARAIRDRYSKGDAGRVVGVYRWPSPDTPTCRGCATKKVTAWSRDPRGGWLVCGTCGHRHPDAARKWLGAALFDWLGYNLLPRRLTPRVFRNPE